MEYRREAGENGGGKIQGLSARMPLERIEHLVCPAGRKFKNRVIRRELPAFEYRRLSGAV